MDVSALYQVFLSASGVSIDSRSITEGQLFFALRGTNFNGSAYAEMAVNNGAILAVIDDPAYVIPGRTLLVEDTLVALQQLAHHHRQQFDIPVIAITGSNGKTTSKELTQRVLSGKYDTLYTFGNLNNHIGVPLTLLRISNHTELAVIEMGANHQQEIASLCRIAAPTHGFICSIGKAHIEGFGGLEGVMKGKGELYDYLLEHKGTLFVNLSTPHLSEILNNRDGNIVMYGIPEKDIYGEILTEQPFVKGYIYHKGKRYTVSSKLIGSYNFGNIVNAFAIGIYFKVPVDDIVNAIHDYSPQNNRSEVRQMEDYELIMDAYNANPTSMSNAIRYFSNRTEGRKVLIIGDMFELGQDALLEHQAIIDQISETDIGTVVIVGSLFGATRHPDNYLSFPSAAVAKAWWKAYDRKGSIVLVKGSRGMGLEKIFEE